MKKTYLQPLTLSNPFRTLFSVCVGSLNAEVNISGGGPGDPGEEVAPIPGRF